MGKISVIIPARYSSTRLKAKPLIEIKGKPIIQWVWEAAAAAKLADEAIIATDDELIFNAAHKFGAKAVMTSPEHKSGTDRIAEIVKNDKDIEIALNVQGDEPMIKASSIDSLIKCISEDKTIQMATIIRKIHDKDELSNPNVVKVVTDVEGNGLYFSRSQIPYERNIGESDFYAHIGVYAYRREALLKFTQFEQTNLEKSESLEQLRMLQNGYKIKTVEIDYKLIGIDTPQDLEEFKAAVAG